MIETGHLKENRRRARQTARRGGGLGVSTGATRFGLKVRKCFVLDGRLHYCRLPKLAVVNLIGLSPFSIQSLAIGALITFPIRLQIVPRWTQKPVLAGGSPLTVVKVSHPKGVEDQSGDLIYKGDHIY